MAELLTAYEAAMRIAGSLRQREDLDVDYIRAKVAEMMGVDDERVITWDRIVREQLELEP